MLVLMRKKNEELKIGSDITIKILELSDGQVKIGITAPADVQVLRSEIFEKIKERNIAAFEQSENKPGNINKFKINKLE